MPILIDGRTSSRDNKGFLLDNEEVSDLLEIRHWWKNRGDAPAGGSTYGGRYGEPNMSSAMYSSNYRSNSYGYGSNSFGDPEAIPEPPGIGFRKPRSQSANFDMRNGPYMMSNRPPRSARAPRSPRRRGRKKRHKSKVGGIRNMISRAVHRSASVDNGDGGRRTSSRRRANKFRQQYLGARQNDGDDSDDSESSSAREDFVGTFHKDRKALPKLLSPGEKRDWDKMTVQQQIERLKNSARRECLIAQAKLWEAQEKQQLLQQLSESDNLEVVKQALGKMKNGTSDPIFQRLTNCVMDGSTPAGHSGANGRTRRNSDGEVFE